MLRGVTGPALAKAGLDGEIRQGGHQRLVDVELALLGQLHGCCRGKDLGDRAGAIHGFRCGRNLVFQVGVSVAFLPDHFLIVDQCNAQAGDVVIRHFAVDQPIQVFFDISVISTGTASGNRRRSGAGTQEEQGAGGGNDSMAEHGDFRRDGQAQQGAIISQMNRPPFGKIADKFSRVF